MQAMESMSKWKTQIRNKIEDSNIEELVKVLQDRPDEQIQPLAKQVRSVTWRYGLLTELSFWNTGRLLRRRIKSLASLRLNL